MSDAHAAITAYAPDTKGDVCAALRLAETAPGSPAYARGAATLALAEIASLRAEVERLARERDEALRERDEAVRCNRVACLAEDHATTECQRLRAALDDNATGCVRCKAETDAEVARLRAEGNEVRASLASAEESLRGLTLELDRRFNEGVEAAARIFDLQAARFDAVQYDRQANDFRAHADKIRAIRAPFPAPSSVVQCSEVTARGTHYPLAPGESCVGCGVIVPGSLAPRAPAEDAAPCARCGCLPGSHPVPPTTSASIGSVASTGCNEWVAPDAKSIHLPDLAPAPSTEGRCEARCTECGGTGRVWVEGVSGPCSSCHGTGRSPSPSANPNQEK